MSSTKKIAGLVASLVVLSFGLSLFFKDSTVEHSSTPKPELSLAEDVQGFDFNEPPGSATGDGLSITQEEFDQLSRERQDEMLEEFVFDFWERELGLPDDAKQKERSLSLEIFNRPYMQTLTEREFAQLSPEDQEEAMVEVMENCRQVRSYVMDVIAEAESRIADKDYAKAEAYFVYSLEMGRELSVNKEGLVITRLVGIACEKVALNGLVKLYTETGDDSKVQMAREQLSEIESEVEEIRNTARQLEANSSPKPETPRRDRAR